MDTTSRLFVKLRDVMDQAGAGRVNGQRLLGMYHSSLDPPTEKAILMGFISGQIRCLVTTVAFGMGMDVPDVDVVFHYSAPDDTLEYWQEVGRCARDGRPGRAVFLNVHIPGTKATIPSLAEDCASSQRCFRKAILDTLWPPSICRHVQPCCFGCSM